MPTIANNKQQALDTAIQRGAAALGGLKLEVFTECGSLRRGHDIEKVLNVWFEDTMFQTADGDTISLVPSIAGGSTVAAPPEQAALSPRTSKASTACQPSCQALTTSQ